MAHDAAQRPGPARVITRLNGPLAADVAEIRDGLGPSRKPAPAE